MKAVEQHAVGFIPSHKGSMTMIRVISEDKSNLKWLVSHVTCISCRKLLLPTTIPVKVVRVLCTIYKTAQVLTNSYVYGTLTIFTLNLE